MIIVQEIIHYMRIKKGRKGYVPVKVNLEKAYDKLSWGFLKEILEMVQVPTDILDLIMSYVQAS